MLEMHLYSNMNFSTFHESLNNCTHLVKTKNIAYSPIVTEFKFNYYDNIVTPQTLY